MSYVFSYLNYLQNLLILNESNLLQLNSEKAKLELGWKPVLRIDDTLDFTYQWYYDYFINKRSAIEITDKQIDMFMKKNENN